MKIDFVLNINQAGPFPVGYVYMPSSLLLTAGNYFMDLIVTHCFGVSSVKCVYVHVCVVCVHACIG